MSKQWLDISISKVGKRFGFDADYFVKGGGWLVLPILLSYPLGMVRTIVFARLATQDLLGQYTFILSIVGLTTVLSLPGINTALIETVARGNHGSLLVAMRARAKWGLLATGTVGLVAVYYARQNSLEFGIAIAAAGLFVPISAAGSCIMQFYTGTRRYARLSWLNIGLLLLRMIVLFALLWSKASIIWLVTGESIATALYYLVQLIPLSRRVKNEPRDDQMVALGRTLTWANSITIVTGQLDSLILGSYLGFSDLAVYRIATILPDNTKNLMKPSLDLILPKIAANPEKQINTRSTRRQLLMLLAINVLIVGAAIILLPFIIPLFYGSQYNRSIPLAQLLMLSLVFNWPSTFFLAALQARKQTKSLYYSNAIFGVLQTGTLAIGVFVIGIWAAALDSLVARWTVAAYQWRAVSKL